MGCGSEEELETRVPESLGTGVSLLEAAELLPCGRVKAGRGVRRAWGTLSFLESLLGPFLKLTGWGGDHCGSDLALRCF